MEHNGDYRSCPVMELESIGGDMKINTDATHMMFSADDPDFPSPILST
jgi:hypothetical protein